MKNRYALIVCLLFATSFSIHAQPPGITWAKCRGRTGPEQSFCIKQTNDGGYIVAGSALSNDGEVLGNHGYFDFWVVKLDGSGFIQWQKCLGAGGLQEATSIEQTFDGGYIVGGNTSSDNSGDVTGTHKTGISG